MGRGSGGAAAVGAESQGVSVSDVPVVSSSDVAVLNTAITQLVSRTAPPARPVTMLYDRWARFAQSPARQRSDAELEPVLRAFAVAYRSAANGRVAVDDQDARILQLASGDPVSIELAGKQLDAALLRVGQSPGGPAPWYKNPLVLLAGGALAVKFLGKKGGKRK